MFKVKLATLVFNLSFISIASADYIGFQSGPEFHATPVEGTVIMTCENGNNKITSTYKCRDVVLDPRSADYFIGPVDPTLNQVFLTSLHEDGTFRSKSSGYDGVAGKSQTPINLWISTLFQKPLLMKGVNRVRYSFKSNIDSQITSFEDYGEGEIIVRVKTGVNRRCPTTQYRSTDPADCSSQYSICQRYFENYNNCR
jgi:hypothetical protein